MPYSSQMNRPQNDSAKPRTQSIRDAPTEPTDPRMDDGVEKIPVPIMRPTLPVAGVSVVNAREHHDNYMSRVQLKTPR